MAWYEERPCGVCGKTIGKRYFWQAKPRLLDASGSTRDCAYVAAEQADALLRTHVLACAPCYFERFGEAKVIAGSLGSRPGGA
jgi:hypothetical protein